MARNNRKRVWIDRQIQGALALRVALHWFVFAAVAATLTAVMQYLADPFLTISEHLRLMWQNQGIFAASDAAHATYLPLRLNQAKPSFCRARHPIAARDARIGSGSQALKNRVSRRRLLAWNGQ